MSCSCKRSCTDQRCPSFDNDFVCTDVCQSSNCRNIHEYESDYETHSDDETSDDSDDEWIENVYFEMFLIFAFEFFRVTLFGFKPLTYPLFRVKYKLKMTELDLLTSILVNNDPMLTKFLTIIRESILKYTSKIPKLWKFWSAKYTKIK